MLTLYFSPGACSLASHIGLEESGAPYEAKPILLAKQQQRTDNYLKINPRGKVPSLDADGKILVENTAILTYLARRYELSLGAGLVEGRYRRYCGDAGTVGRGEILEWIRE